MKDCKCKKIGDNLGGKFSGKEKKNKRKCSLNS